MSELPLIKAAMRRRIEFLASAPAPDKATPVADEEIPDGNGAHDRKRIDHGFVNRIDFDIAIGVDRRIVDSGEHDTLGHTVSDVVSRN